MGTKDRQGIDCRLPLDYLYSAMGPSMTFIWLTAGAFLLGACPFAVWIGRLFLSQDIRRYGDGNPGAANVFRAGSVAAGVLAVVLDIGKGVPFVLLAGSVYHLPPVQVVAVGLAAMLGHAFSPLLHFKGGKALAVTAGVIIGLLNPELLWSFFLSALLFFIVLEEPCLDSVVDADNHARLPRI